MPERVPDKPLLQGEQVALTGRLASITRTEAAELIRVHGGRFSATVNRLTSLLVIGQDGWPFDEEGRLSSKLRKVRYLRRKGYRIDVLTEEELLARLGLETPVEGVSRLFSTAQVARLLKIPGDRIRRWVTAGLIRPVMDAQGVSYFDYGQVVSARTMSGLVEAGVKPDRLRRSLEQLQNWMASIEQPLQQLAVLENNGRLLVRLDDGLADASGQRHFDFDDDLDATEVCLHQPPVTAERLFAQGCQLEDDECWDEAIAAYRRALLVGGPNPVICFNLANVFYAKGAKEQAVERYYQAVELDRTAKDAWNNLGVVLSDLGRTREAIAAFEQCLAIDPEYADARYNLADLLDELGEETEAAAHWHSYYTSQQEVGARRAWQRMNGGGRNST